MSLEQIEILLIVQHTRYGREENTEFVPKSYKNIKHKWLCKHVTNFLMTQNMFNNQSSERDPFTNIVVKIFKMLFLKRTVGFPKGITALRLSQYCSSLYHFQNLSIVQKIFTMCYLKSRNLMQITGGLRYNDTTWSNFFLTCVWTVNRLRKVSSNFQTEWRKRR